MRKISKKPKGKKSKKVIIAIEIIALILMSLVAFAYLKFGKLNFFALGNVKTYMDTGPYTNIALFGLDSREGTLGAGNNSDTIIIASINNKTKDVKLASIYRDTLLQMEDGSYNKANAAYAMGGPEEAVNMLNKNLDLDIQKYVTINFSAITHSIDYLGGIDVEMTEEERVWMNGYIAETSEATGVWSPTIDDQTGDGVYHLNGTQATAYCRVRYTDGNDFRRTERQRTVLNKMIEKAKTAKFRTLNKIVNNVLPLCMTNLTSSNFLGYAFTIKRFNMVDQKGFPTDLSYADLDCGSCVIPDTLASNVEELHKFLFSDQKYTISDNIQSISNDIAYIVGTNTYTEEEYTPDYGDYYVEEQPAEAPVEETPDYSTSEFQPSDSGGASGETTEETIEPTPEEGY